MERYLKPSDPPKTRRKYVPPSRFRDWLIGIKTNGKSHTWYEYDKQVSKGTINHFRKGGSPLIDPNDYEIKTGYINKIEHNKSTVWAKYVGRRNDLGGESTNQS